jgi:hypothetical protein
MTSFPDVFETTGTTPNEVSSLSRINRLCAAGRDHSELFLVVTPPTGVSNGLSLNQANLLFLALFLLSENKIESGRSAQQSWMLREGVHPKGILSPRSPPVFIACGETQFNENSYDNYIIIRRVWRGGDGGTPPRAIGDSFTYIKNPLLFQSGL